jgi:fucose 4-O-acetylase-like acetyltransferase
MRLVSMPSRETIWFVPLLVVSLLIAMAFTIFLSPAIGIPLLLLAAIFGAVGWFRKDTSTAGRVDNFRQQAQPDVEFTERDRETLTPPESGPAH